MDAKNNDPNEHEQKKSPLTTIPLLNSCLSQSISHPGGGGDPAYERLGMLVVSLRGVNFEFWSHLGCSGKNPIIFSREGLV